MADVVTLGEAMILLVGDDDASLRLVTRFRRSVAGAESNVAIGVRRLGRSARWIGRVGSDAFGEVVLRLLRAEGIEVDGAVVEGRGPTGILVRDRHAERPINVSYYRGGSAGSFLSADDIRPEDLMDARVLHISGVTAALSASALEAVRRAVHLAGELDVPVCFDPNFRRKLWRPEEATPILRELAAKATLVIAGREEAALVAECEGSDALAAWYLERGVKLVVITDGARGCWATDGERRWEQRACPARVVDPVGAGDAFAAGFLSRWLASESVDRCLLVGAVVAGMAIESVGDIDGLPFEDEVSSRITGKVEVQR